ncbi:hypothetical protein [uncultured Variovorax sp.]|uniref:hypothetical protein n=1 Tax=uncultured Variovorax sp. TaxID=114708 RepID=UPI0025ED74DC|nr:hypothetical protein [uncultured Variovorax sp.]
MSVYEELFDDYVVEMRQARAVALAWWQALLLGETRAGADAKAAQEAVDRRWPLGPASHPFVIEVFRKYALECQRLNDEAEEGEEDEGVEDAEDAESDWGCEDVDEEDEQADLETLEAPVEPRELLIEMLPNRVEDLAEFMADFVFTPLGLDKNERWI